jgi:poly(A) polymerase
MEIFGLKPSKEVGILKEVIREAILEGIIPNEIEAARTYLIEEGLKQGLEVIKEV